MSSRISRSDVGAWVLVGNPAVWQYFDARDDEGLRPGDTTLNNWSVASNYRTDLIERGDLVVLWIGGRVRAGIHEIGIVDEDVSSVEDTIEATHLGDEAKRKKYYRFVQFRSLILAQPLSVADLRSDPRLAGCEHFRAPQVASPSYLTPSEVDALRTHLTRAELRRAGWPS